jgi:Fic family protein
MASPRKSLQEAFPELSIPSAPKSFRNAFKTGWPLGGSQKLQNGVFTIRLAAQLQDEESKLHLPAHPATIINEARNTTKQSSAVIDVAWEELKKSFISLVYGSNKIETAGSSLPITIKLCQDIFRGKNVSVEIEERDPLYQDHMKALGDTGRKMDKVNVVRSRREIILHAKALDYMIDHIVLRGETWSEELILETHKILYHGLGDEDVVAGQYRTHEVAVSYGKPGEKPKKSVCMRARAVPQYMKQMVDELNKEIADSEASHGIDPYTLAARYHHQFVMIHPFGDGNGRMSRIILNVLLLKYAGHVTLFGSDNDDKEDYLNIVRRGHKIFNEEDMEVEFRDHTSHHEFAKFVFRKSKTGLESIWAWATQRQGK